MPFRIPDERHAERGDDDGLDHDRDQELHQREARVVVNFTSLRRSRRRSSRRIRTSPRPARRVNGELPSVRPPVSVIGRGCGVDRRGARAHRSDCSRLEPCAEGDHERVRARGPRVVDVFASPSPEVGRGASRTLIDAEVDRARTLNVHALVPDVFVIVIESVVPLVTV